MARKQSGCACSCGRGCICHHSMLALALGVAILLAVGMRYIGYGYREIALVFGILFVLKGIYKYMKCKCK